MTEKEYTVYVLFHGLWAFESKKDRILAHTPFEEEHTVRAGYFERPGGVLADRTLPLYSGRAHVTGVTYGDKTRFDPAQNVIVVNAPFQSKIADKRFGVVDVGKPIDILSLRRVKVQPPPRVPFAGTKGEDLHPEEVSMVQVFVYSTAGPDRVGISSSRARPHIDTHKRVAKIHVYAEPPGMPPPLHARDAYTQMAEMFDVEIVPIAPLFVPYKDPGVYGLDADDMRMLNEQTQGPMMGMGSKASNCDALVIDNADWTDPDSE